MYLLYAASRPHPKLDRMRKELDQAVEWSSNQLNGVQFQGSDEVQKCLKGLSKLPSEQVLPTLKRCQQLLYQAQKKDKSGKVKSALDGLYGAMKAAGTLSGSTKSDAGLYKTNLKFKPRTPTELMAAEITEEE